MRDNSLSKFVVGTVTGTVLDTIRYEENKKFISLYLRERFTTNDVPEDECDKEAEFILGYLGL